MSKIKGDATMKDTFVPLSNKDQRELVLKVSLLKRKVIRLEHELNRLRES